MRPTAILITGVPLKLSPLTVERAETPSRPGASQEALVGETDCVCKRWRRDQRQEYPHTARRDFIDIDDLLGSKLHRSFL